MAALGNSQVTRSWAGVSLTFQQSHGWVGWEALRCKIGKLLNVPGKPLRTELSVALGAKGIFMLGKKCTAQAPGVINICVLLLEAPQEAGLGSLSG